MELNNLKEAWKRSAGADSLKSEDIHKMIREKNHPVLAGIRRQLIFESSVWTIFLFAYYSMFDGDQKPFYANILLVAAVVLLIVHNVTGFLAQQKLIKGLNLKQSLDAYLSSIRGFKVYSIATRVAAIICLLVFFTSVIGFNTFKYGMLAGLIILIPLQILVLSQIWNARIDQLKKLMKEFSE
jgi:hypothetical protein